MKTKPSRNAKKEDHKILSSCRCDSSRKSSSSCKQGAESSGVEQDRAEAKVTINKTSINLNFTILLALLFITLKLCGVIAWAWLWVLSPLWIPVIIVIGFIALGALIAVVSSLFEK